jgi:hypothetical protein
MLLPIATKLNPVADPRFHLSALHAQVVASKVNNRAVSERTQEADVDTRSARVASRLDGLRNLVTVLRPKQMKTSEVPYESKPAPVSASLTATSLALLTAQPESVRSNLFTDTSVVQRSAKSAASDRPDRSVRVGEVAILPSRPGQYKKK